MKIILWMIGAVMAFVAAFYAFNAYIYHEKQADSPALVSDVSAGTPRVVPIMHATAAILWGDMTILTDPTGGEKSFKGFDSSGIILITDLHGDHLSTSTLASIIRPDTSLVVPKAVADLLPLELATRAQILANGQTITVRGFSITGAPMYNIPETDDARHTKGRGNGYIVEKDGFRVYVAGDTAGTPEMRALEDIDVALVPMNLPYTMSVEEAAEAVLAFKPRVVYPYHYRGPDGLSDVDKFKRLVNASNQEIEVRLENWYPKTR